MLFCITFLSIVYIYARTKHTTANPLYVYTSLYAVYVVNLSIYSLWRKPTNTALFLSPKCHISDCTWTRREPQQVARRVESLRRIFVSNDISLSQSLSLSLCLSVRTQLNPYPTLLSTWTRDAARRQTSWGGKKNASVSNQQFLRASDPEPQIDVVLRLPGPRLCALPGVRSRRLLVGGAALRGPAAAGAARPEEAVPPGERLPQRGASGALPAESPGREQLRGLHHQQRLGELELGLHLRAVLRQHRVVHHR